MVRDGKPKAVIVGGSIAGVSTAHALTIAGWDVVVLEKTTAPSTGSPTGAGLGLDSLSQTIIESWLSQPHLLRLSTLPLTIDQNQVADSEKKENRILTRDENFNFRAAHWGDLHGLLYNALPPNVFLWGHLFLSFQLSDDKASVIAKAKVLKTGEILEIVGDLLVAADGCLSSIRQKFLPHFKLRYSGYWAWRGVLDFSEAENSETIIAVRKAYPDLGKCLYFDLGLGTHGVFYELLNKRLNWIWYVNQPEPQVQGTSVTMKVSREMIQRMLQEAEDVWIPELVNVMKETKDPFLNFIYDYDPLEKIFWDNVVLVGDAAHPTTPHCVRSTNMSVLDAAVLGKCMEKWGFEKLQSALEEYQSIRVPVTSKQVLHARRLGRIKQGLVLHDRESFNPKSPRPEDCQELLQKNTPFFNHVPSVLGFDTISSSN
ncbi:Aurachin C monooxygenase/isomerase [Senna tora]|uniref:Aurachin C monooxygenase/isomerase n=1 Tax=Senna tora TaxID=362788 RepID=A0A834T7J7_9FABA|nr:Aurachin C monooxygenase/isomerase [Senna tora]